MNTITPGPWHVVPAIGQPGMWEIRPEGHFRGNIATVFHTTISAPTIPFAEAEANARAIALLPELVEALDMAMESLNESVVSQEWDCRPKIRAVLSKLKGQP